MCISLPRGALALVPFLLSPARPEDRPPAASEPWSVMGTYAAVSASGKDQGRLAALVGATKGIFEDLNGSLSTYRPDSEVSRLSKSSAKEPVSVTKSTREVLALSVRYAEQTGGAFDPTVAPLVFLWGFSGGKRPVRLPDAATIEAAKRLVGYKHVIISEKSAYLDMPGMAVDLGGIAKGYAVDVAYDKLVALGAEGFLINLGGNVRCRGKAESARPWTIGVRNPFEKEDLVGVVHLSTGLAAATSGNYEQFVTIEGERYCHIIDPRTGLPVKGMAGVTVISETAVETDALSTALFVLGPEKSKPILARHPRSHALFIPDKRPLEIWVSKGFKKHFTPGPEFAGSVKDLGD